MKISKKEFLELLNKEEERIISECAFENDILNSFKDELFDSIHEQSSLEAYLFEESDSFSNKGLSLEYIFQNRKHIFQHYIYETLSYPPTTLKTYLDIDNVYSNAGFRWLLNSASSIQDDLLAVFSIRELADSLSDLSDSVELDASDYGNFSDTDDLVESFVSEIVSKAQSVNEILNIEGYSKELFDEYFNL